MVVYLKFWREIAILILTILVIIVYLWKDNQAKALEVDLAQYKSGLDYQNAALLKEAEEHKRKLAELPKEITTIKTRYVAVYGGIDNFEKDENESDCNASYRLLTTFPY